MEKYKVEERAGRASARKGRAHIKIVHKWAGNGKNYAKKYRTWMPTKEWVKPVKSKKGPKRLRPPQGSHPGRRTGPRNGPPNKRRKVKPPPRGNHLRRPTPPPPELDYDYISEEEYFPEETKRNEYESNERRPPRKKQGMRRKPAKKIKPERHRPTEDYPTVSYSNFIQHPASTASNFDYGDFADDEPIQTHQKDRRKKKKRKGDRIRVRDHAEDQFGANSQSFEDASLQNYEQYPPYYDDPPLKRPIRHPLPQTIQPTPIYGDGYLGQQVNVQRFPQNVNVNRGVTDPAGLGRYRNDINPGAGQTFANTPYEANNYNNFGVSNNHPDIITQQNYKQFANTGLVNSGHGPHHFAGGFQHQPTITPTNYNSNNQQVVSNFNPPVNYNQNYAINRPVLPHQQTTNTQTFQNVIPTNRGNEYSSKYKSNSFFDNTETFQDFNHNVNYNQQNNLGTKRPNNFIPSTEYQDPVDADSEFINRHQDLYSNGVKGVPVQGDGRPASRTKDYDIGYGEIQYDETHRT